MENRWGNYSLCAYVAFIVLSVMRCLTLRWDVGMNPAPRYVFTTLMFLAFVLSIVLGILSLVKGEEKKIATFVLILDALTIFLTFLVLFNTEIL